MWVVSSRPWSLKNRRPPLLNAYNRQRIGDWAPVQRAVMTLRLAHIYTLCLRLEAFWSQFQDLSGNAAPH